jgi:predicted phosphodiesterase
MDRRSGIQNDRFARTNKTRRRFTDSAFFLQLRPGSFGVRGFIETGGGRKSAPMRSTKQAARFESREIRTDRWRRDTEVRHQLLNSDLSLLPESLYDSLLPFFDEHVDYLSRKRKRVFVFFRFRLTVFVCVCYCNRMEPIKQAATLSSQPHSVLCRAGLIGDVHGHSALLEIALRFLTRQKELDAILCTGDLPGDTANGDTDVCCKLLSEARVLSVRGNHDRWSIENQDQRVLLGISDQWPLASDSIEYLKTLPPTREFETPLGPVLLCHGTGEDDQTGVYPNDIEFSLETNEQLKAVHDAGRIRLMIAGHTHQRMVRTLDHLTLINSAAVACEKSNSLPTRLSPGTALRRKNPCFSIVDFENRYIQFYNIDRVSYEIAEADRFAL